VRGSGDEFVEGVVSWYFNLVIALLFSAIMGVVVLVATMMRRDLDPALGYGVIGSAVVGFALVSRWLLRVKREAPEKVVGFLQRLGLYRHRG
jgi:hypothetical protein